MKYEYVLLVPHLVKCSNCLRTSHLCLSILYLSKCTTFFFFLALGNCGCINYHWLVRKIEAKWSQMLDSECFISDLLLLFISKGKNPWATSISKFALQNKFEKQLYILYHPIFNSNRFCAGNPTQPSCHQATYLIELNGSTCRGISWSN